MNKNDLRYVKTERAIKSAFFELIDEQGFDRMSVTDVCDRCLISRNAFYTHYQSKEDLLNSIYADVEYLFMNKFEIRDDIRGLTETYLKIINDNKTMFYALLRCPTIGFKKVILDTVILKPSEKFFNKKLNYEKLPIKIRLTLTYMVDAMISFTTEWLSHYNELSLEDAVDELTILCTFPTNHNYELLSNMK